MRIEDRISVLFIDSKDTDRNYYADRLKISSPEYVIYEAANGQAGLALYESQPVDCVILEIELSDMSGFEALTRLVPVARKPEVAVIVLTNLTNPFLLELALKNGALAALLKSSTPGDVLDKAILRAVSTVQRDRKREGDTPFVQVDLPEDSLTAFHRQSLLDTGS